MKSSDRSKLRAAAIEAVRRAARLTQAVQSQRGPLASLNKQDRSPVTVADFGAQAVVQLTLEAAGGGIPVVGEENAEVLRAGDLRTDGQQLRTSVVQQVAAVLPGTTEEAVLHAIDACSDPGGATGRRWVLDPIDGTLGYLREGQYAIALALQEEGRPVLGVLGCPSLPRTGGGIGCLFVAEEGHGAVEIGLEPAWETGEHQSRTLRVASVSDGRDAVFCESVEAAHSAHHRHARIAQDLGVTSQPVRMDSQCKYAAVARGDASIYLRFPTDALYREKIWDHAAGSIVITEAGGRVTDVDGRALDFSLGRTLTANRGIIATNGLLHDRVLAAIQATA